MSYLLFKMGRRIAVGMLLVALISTGLAVSQAAPHTQNDSPLVAALEVTSPQVSYRADAEDDWQPLESERTVLAAGDHIRTDADGKAIVTWFEDGTFMEIGPNTEVVFDEISMAEEGDSFTIDMALLKGRLIQSVDRLVDDDSTYQVRSGSVTVSVRGTVFAVDVDSQGVVSIAASEGTLHVLQEVLPSDDVDHILEEFQLGQDQMALIAPDGTITETSLQAARAGGDSLAQALADFEEWLTTLEDLTDTEIDLPDGEVEESIDLLDDTLDDTLGDTEGTLDDLGDGLLDNDDDDSGDDGDNGDDGGDGDTGSLLNTEIISEDEPTTESLLSRTNYLFNSLRD